MGQKAVSFHWYKRDTDVHVEKGYTKVSCVYQWQTQTLLRITMSLEINKKDLAPA